MSTETVHAGIWFLLNGRHVHVRDTPVHATLLVFLRSEGVTGAKDGCAEGECGACSVLIDGILVNSCLIPALQIEGTEIDPCAVTVSAPGWPSDRSWPWS